MNAEPDRPPTVQESSETRIFQGRAEYRVAIREALELAATVGCRDMVWADPDFADCPLGERQVVDCLSRWAKSHRSLTIVAARFDSIERLHPRFVAWRRTWSHVVHCRQTADADAGGLPSLLLASGLLSLRLFDPVHFRGRVSRLRSDEVHDADHIDAFLQRSHDSFPVTRLGL